MSDYISYIIRFLLGNSYSEEIARHIGYTDNTNEFHRYKLVIIPSGFFRKENYGLPHSLPTLPLKKIEEVPLLYGSPDIIQKDDKLIVSADIIASSYFLLSRYEEYIRKDVRDIHGRFPGKESLPYKEGFINRPIVDEYGSLLKGWLKQVGFSFPETSYHVNTVYLTHDIDIPFHYRSILSFAKGMLFSKNRKIVIRSFFGNIVDNPAYTYPWIIEQNNKLKSRLKNSHYQSVFFFKVGGKTREDRPFYNLYSKDIQTIFALCRENDIDIELHASYQASFNPQLILNEKEQLEEATKSNVKLNRNHFLCSREPEDMIHLINAGITDDFTMGYADVSGFRLGTCRPVHWINPADKKVHSLLLHPLTVMECTLDRPEYMGLDYDSAMTYCKGLIDQTAKFNGDLVLLWHNTTLIDSSESYQKKLYQFVLNYVEH